MFTTHQAAEILNVSHAYLIKLLKQGRILYREAENQQIILTQSLLKYKAVEEEKANRALEEIVFISEKLGLYD